MDPTSQNIGFTSTPAPIGVKKKGSKMWIVVVVVVLLLLGGYFVYSNIQQNKEAEKQQEVVVPTEEPIATPTEEATPSGTLTPSPRPTTGAVTSATDLNVQVLNGNGVVGAAGQVKDHLASKGYKNLETGNADNFDYEKVSVRIKASQQKFLATIQKDLQEKYELATDSGTLSPDSLFDVSIIVGK